MQAFMTAWQKVCKSTPDQSVFLVPKGKFVVSTMFFAGPCTPPNPVTIQLEGTMLAPTDASEYVNGDWLMFQDLVGINIVGGGCLDARGHKMWPFFEDCDVKPSTCVRLPAVSSTLYNLILLRIHYALLLKGELLFSSFNLTKI